MAGPRVVLGNGEDERYLDVKQAVERRGVLGRGVAVVGTFEVAALGVIELVEAGEQARAPDTVKRSAALAGQAGSDVHRSGRVPGQHDAARVAAVAGDAVADPPHGGRAILGAGRP